MTGAPPATGSFQMLGDVGAAVCEGDSCLVPTTVGAESAAVGATPLQTAAGSVSAEAASARAVVAALDEGDSV